MRKDWPFTEPTGWLPSAMLDEVTPPARKTPDDWIVQRLLNGVKIAGPDEDEGSQTGRQFVALGAIVAFSAFFDLGTIEIEVSPHGIWKPSNPLVIEGSIAKATGFCEEGDGETFATSLDDLALNYAEISGPMDGPELVTVEAWHWSEEIPFALTRSGDNTYTLRQLAEDAS